MAGSRSAALISPLSRSMISAGVPRGAPTPKNALASRKWPIVLVTLKDRTLSPAARSFIDALRAEI
jgi:hypothetical protein